MNVRHFKKLHLAFDTRVKQLMIDLVGVFRAGKEILPPEERLAKADQYLELANLALDLLPILLELEKLVERIKEQRGLFARANKLRDCLSAA